jgi:hypothetical protein
MAFLFHYIYNAFSARSKHSDYLNNMVEKADGDLGEEGIKSLQEVCG